MSTSSDRLEALIRRNALFHFARTQDGRIDLSSAQREVDELNLLLYNLKYGDQKLGLSDKDLNRANEILTDIEARFGSATPEEFARFNQLYPPKPAAS